MSLYRLYVSRTVVCFFFLMIRRPPRSTLDRSSAASDVYKRQAEGLLPARVTSAGEGDSVHVSVDGQDALVRYLGTVSYTHLRAHETVLDLVCRLLLEKKTQIHQYENSHKRT